LTVNDRSAGFQEAQGKMLKKHMFIRIVLPLLIIWYLVKIFQVVARPDVFVHDESAPAAIAYYWHLEDVPPVSLFHLIGDYLPHNNLAPVFGAVMALPFYTVVGYNCMANVLAGITCHALVLAAWLYLLASTLPRRYVYLAWLLMICAPSKLEVTLLGGFFGAHEVAPLVLPLIILCCLRSGKRWWLLAGLLAGAAIPAGLENFRLPLFLLLFAICSKRPGVYGVTALAASGVVPAIYTLYLGMSSTAQLSSLKRFITLYSGESIYNVPFGLQRHAGDALMLYAGEWSGVFKSWFFDAPLLSACAVGSLGILFIIAILPSRVVDLRRQTTVALILYLAVFSLTAVFTNFRAMDETEGLVYSYRYWLALYFVIPALCVFALHRLAVMTNHRRLLIGIVFIPLFLNGAADLFWFAWTATPGEVDRLLAHRMEMQVGNVGHGLYAEYGFPEGINVIRAAPALDTWHIRYFYLSRAWPEFIRLADPPAFLRALPASWQHSLLLVAGEQFAHVNNDRPDQTEALLTALRRPDGSGLLARPWLPDIFYGVGYASMWYSLCRQDHTALVEGPEIVAAIMARMGLGADTATSNTLCSAYLNGAGFIGFTPVALEKNRQRLQQSQSKEERWALLQGMLSSTALIYDQENPWTRRMQVALVAAAE